jgi:hypothetical protein
MNLLNNDIDLFESILFLYLETRLEMEAEQSKEERVTSMMSNLSLETTPPASLLKTKINEIEIEAKLLIFGGWETPVWVSWLYTEQLLCRCKDWIRMQSTRTNFGSSMGLGVRYDSADKTLSIPQLFFANTLYRINLELNFVCLEWIIISDGI